MLLVRSRDRTRSRSGRQAVDIELSEAHSGFSNLTCHRHSFEIKFHQGSSWSVNSVFKQTSPELSGCAHSLFKFYILGRALAFAALHQRIISHTFRYCRANKCSLYVKTPLLKMKMLTQHHLPWKILEIDSMQKQVKRLVLAYYKMYFPVLQVVASKIETKQLNILASLQ